jgi:signal transduction histidine kinase
LSLGIFAAGFFSYRGFEVKTRSDMENHLTAVAELKTAEIVQWRRERLADGGLFFANLDFTELVRRSVDTPGNAENKFILRHWLEKIAVSYGYDSVSLLDLEGKTTLAYPSDHFAAVPELLEGLASAVEEGRPLLVDFFRDPADGRKYLAVLTPIHKLILCLLIDPEKYLFPLIHLWPTQSETTETLVVRRTGGEAVYLNDLRFQKNTSLELKIPLTRTEMPAVQAALGRRGIWEGRDYRNVPVLASIREVPESPWFIIAKIDLEEVFGPVRGRLQITIVAILALLLAEAAWIVFSIKHREIGFYREKSRAAETFNKELERQVKERTSRLELLNKELEAFAHSISHDLRTPLRAIDGFSRILVEEYAERLDPEGIRLLNVVRSNTQRMGNLITDILALSRLTRTEPRRSRIDMEAMVNSVLQEILPPEDRKNLSVILGPLSPAVGDPALIRQVWINLISNAIKFSRPKADGRIEIGSAENKDENTYYVKDNGVGFNPDYTHKLFGAFQRLHKAEDFEGTGVGLAIVLRIVTRHGGRVWAEGKIDGGAVFYFALPAKEEMDENPS